MQRHQLYALNLACLAKTTCCSQYKVQQTDKVAQGSNEPSVYVVCTFPGHATVHAAQKPALILTAPLPTLRLVIPT